MSYNLKITAFPSGITRVQLYSYEVKEGVTNNKHNTPLFHNPFDDELCKEVDDFTTEHEYSVNQSLKRTRQKLYEYCQSNTWEWFFTLTLNKEKVDRYSYKDACRALRDYIRHVIWRYNDNAQYVFVPELHKDGAYHFHGLLSGVPNLKFVDSGIKQNGRTVYNLDDFKYGFSTATKVGDSEKAAGYLCKYITKELCAATPGKKRYWNSRNLILPVKFTSSVDFGEDKQMVIDSFRSACQYEKSMSSPDGERRCLLFEFPFDFDIDFSVLDKYRFR